MKKYLFLDDIRDPKDDLPWHIVRTYDEAILWMSTHGCPNVLALDHDLGMKLVGTKLVTDDYNALNGIDVVLWIIAKDVEMKRTFIPKDFIYTIHSSNPTGSQNMDRAFKEYLL
jgi:hypothetical protein